MPVAAIIPIATLAVAAAGTGASIYLQTKAQKEATAQGKELAKRAAAAGRSTTAEQEFENLQLVAAAQQSLIEEKEKNMAEDIAEKVNSSKTILILVLVGLGIALAWWYLKKRKARA